MTDDDDANNEREATLKAAARFANFQESELGQALEALERAIFNVYGALREGDYRGTEKERHDASLRFITNDVLRNRPWKDFSARQVELFEVLLAYALEAAEAVEAAEAGKASTEKLTPARLSARMVDMRLSGEIVPSGTRRRTRTGAMSDAYTLSELTPGRMRQ